MRINIDDLPEKYRQQARRQINASTTRQALQETLQPAERVNVQVETPKPAKRAPTAITRKGPNKTEAEYNRTMLDGRGRYEAITLRLPGGSRYTPDWAVFDANNKVTLHEVKGSYRFHSQGRALTAFREAVAAFPMFGFVWATKQKDGRWEVKNA